MDDYDIDQLFFRRPLPKRRVMNSRARRYSIPYGSRKNFHDNGLIQKVFEVENGKDCGEKVREELERKLRLLKEDQGDGLCPKQVLYSEGKKKRWEMVDRMRNEVPEPEYPTVSSTVTQIDIGNIRTLNNNKVSFMRVAQISNKTINGDETTVKGKLPWNAVHRSYSAMSQPHLNTEYLIHEQKLSNKLKNSNLYPTYKSSLENICPPQIEKHALGLDVCRDFWGNWQTAYRVRFNRESGPRCYSTDELYNPPEKEESEDEDSPKPRGITLADYMPTSLKPRRFRSLSEGWDCIKDE